MTTTDGSSLEMVVQGMHYPLITGYEIGKDGSRRLATIDLNEVHRLEVREVSGGTTAVVLVGASVLLMGMAVGSALGDVGGMSIY